MQSQQNLSPIQGHSHEPSANRIVPSISYMRDSDEPSSSNHHNFYTTEEKYTLISRIVISVEDNGIGIKPEDKAKLFRMFGKVGYNNEKINPQGIGLGLTICNKILGQMGSELQVESEFGKGTRFYFLLDV